MKKTKLFVKLGIAVMLLANVLSLTGCGKKDSESMQTDLERLMDDSEEMFGGGGESDATEDAEYYVDGIDGSDGEDTGSWMGEVYKMEIEGDNSTALNGKITSILSAELSTVIAGAEDGSLFMLSPMIYYSQEDSEIDAYKITDDGGIDDLIYANQHVAYGKNRLVYFDMFGEYEDVDETYMIDSFEMPEYVYNFENVQKADLENDQSLIYMTDDAVFCAYVDMDGQVCANYKDDFSEEYTTYSDVAFEGDTERNDVAVSKGIFNFVLTEDQELLYIKNANIASDYGRNVQGVSLGYTDLTDKIGAKVRDIYNLQNSTYCCYAVDEEQNIYYVSVDWGDEIAVNKVTQFELGTIADIQGFSGTNEKMLIKMEDGSYYYYDDDSYVSTRKIDALDGSYKNVVLLMEGDILALGNDGYLYVVKDKN